METFVLATGNRAIRPKDRFTFNGKRWQALTGAKGGDWRYEPIIDQSYPAGSVVAFQVDTRPEEP